MDQNEKDCSPLRDLETFPPDLEVLASPNNNIICKPSEEFYSDTR